jgi:tripartite-type tricarboxylate transporter receptor subunit TctC
LFMTNSMTLFKTNFALVLMTLVVAAQGQSTSNSAANSGANPPPTQVIKLIVGYAAGGPVDTTARLFAPHFARELGQTVVVENRPGAAGALGGDLVAKSAPNAGLLFFTASPTMTITPHLLKAMPFDPVKDVTAIAPIVSYTNVLVVNKDQPFKTVPELVAYAKANPGKVAYGSAGIGASNHLSGELLALRTGTDMTHVPYKGNAPAMTDVIGGQINMMFDILSTARGYIASGRVRAVAVTSRDRNASMPDVPSMREAGVPDYEVGGWFGIYGPARLPAEVVARYNAATARALANDELKAKLIDQGYDVWTGSPQMLAERAVKELALWGPVTKGIPQQ